MDARNILETLCDGRDTNSLGTLIFSACIRDETVQDSKWLSHENENLPLLSCFYCINTTINSL